MIFDMYRATACKFSQEIMNTVRSHMPRPISDTQFDEFCESMKNRTRIGECRYEGQSWMYLDPEQEAVLGKDWRYGYEFFSQDPELFLLGWKRKTMAFDRSGNRELLIDVVNYVCFYALTSDRAQDVEQLIKAAAAAVEEFFRPQHPTSHYKALDQGIDGEEASGAMSRDPRVINALRRPS